jgi:hypothetical protein
LLAGATLALIPMSVAPQVTRFGRTAMLDPVWTGSWGIGLV